MDVLSKLGCLKDMLATGSKPKVLAPTIRPQISVFLKPLKISEKVN
jgi:hypothetical protein